MEIRDLSLIPTMRKKCDVKNPYGGSLNLSYNFIYSFQKTSCFLSLVHVRNLHPGANFHPGCKFAPGCISGHVNGVLRICTPVQICRCKFAPAFEVVQFYLHPLHPGRMQIVHMNANCIISIHFDWRFR